jgi:general secretion pathway protein D
MRRVLLLAGLAVSLSTGLIIAEEDSPKETALALARAARRAEKKGHNTEAYLLYSEAHARRPQDAKLQGLMESLKVRAELEATRISAAKTSPDANITDHPDIEAAQVFDSMTAREFAAARQMVGPPSLAGKAGVQDFELTGNARSLFDQVAGRFGLQSMYDGDFPATGASIRFRVTGVDFRGALHDLEAATGSFVVPLSSRLFMVSTDTPQKRNDLEQTVAISIPVPQALTTQELTEIGQAVKQATNIDKLSWNSAQDQIVIRDRISRVVPAEALLRQLLAYKSDVMIEVEFIEVTDSDIRNYGFNVTNSFQAIYLGSILNNAITFPSGIANLLTFGGGKTLIGLGVAQAEAMFNETISSGRTLYRAQIRAADGQPATFHAGEKYPVVTSGFFGAVPATQTGTNISPPPTFSFEDLGVELKITPHVHGMGEMTLAVETNFELLTGDAVNGIPIIGRRQMNTTVRLREGEWAVVAGLMNPSESKAVTGFWGLAQIPLLGALFRQTSTNKTDSHILVVIKPQLLSLPPDQNVSRGVRVGSETRPLTPL